VYAETSEKKMTNSRVAFALLCGLAVCCSVMYISADGDEYVHEVVTGKQGLTGTVSVDAGTSVGTTDILKAGQIYTETPDGRMRLMDYFNNVEKEISDEVANRKSDIAAVRAQMARDFAFNAAARATLNKEMLHKMAVNAKLARDNLNKAMRKTQERMAKQASLANRRYKATLKRDKQTDKVINKDKKRSAKALKMAVSAWQKSTSAWASSTNARIDRMNKHVAANAAQIKENAKKARKDLEVTMHKWDKQVSTFRETSKNARSKLSEQFKQQDKATRAWANNKIKGLVAGTASQFNDVETKMSKNRHDVDMALKKAVMKFGAALNAAKALENKRFAQNVANIAAAKREAAEKVDAATSDFKLGLLSLSSTVKEQVQKVNSRIDDTAAVVRSDAAAQAKINANVNAEMTRMIKVGNDRYKHHLKDDAELQDAIASDKESTDEQITKMATEFNSQLNTIRGELAKDRKHAEKSLNAGTQAVWKQLYANTAAQEGKNAAMKEATTRMKLDALDNIRKAKSEFRKKIADLAEVVKTNDVEADKKIVKLTGIVIEEAVKAKKGREKIASLEEMHKNELKASIHKAITDGEKRAKLVEERGTKMDEDTKYMVNSKLNAEITKLRDETNASVEQLALLNKEARLAMKKEMLFAIRSAAEVAKSDLEQAIKTGVAKMIAFETKAAGQDKLAAAERDALKTEVAANAAFVTRMINDAVATDSQAQTALGQETAAALKKTNTDITAYANQMKKIAGESREAIKALNTKTLGEVADEAQRAAKATSDFTADDEARQKAAVAFLAEQLKEAGEKSEKKFGDAYTKLADYQGEATTALAAATKGLNDSLAKQAALADSRFVKTVSDITAARKQAADQVAAFRAEFGGEIIAVTAEIKLVQTKLNGLVAKVSGECQDMKARQYEVNAKVKEELGRIETLSNSRFTESKKARGKLKEIMDKNKDAAAAELAALEQHLVRETDKMRSKNAANKRFMAKSTTHMTEKFYEDLASVQSTWSAGTDATNAATAAAAAASAAKLDRSKALWDSKIVSLTNTVTLHRDTAIKEMQELTGRTIDIADAGAEDRDAIKLESEVAYADLQKALTRAIDDGEAKAKAVEMRIAEHLKDTQRFLRVELGSQVEEAADAVLKTIEGSRQKIADNYLSLKAYSVASADIITDYVIKGKGRGLSAIGDLLVSVGSMGDAHVKPAQGMGVAGHDGKDELPLIFSGDTISVSNAMAAINGLVNEYTDVCDQVTMRWPMGLGKYLMDRVQLSMMDKGVLMVDKVEGKAGNFVFMNGHSVGLSNKLDDFGALAASMTSYESVLAKLTAKVTAPAIVEVEKPFEATGPEWQGN
jgi:hypothetical protein